MGADPSVADAYLYVVLTWAHGKQVDLTGLDNLAAFFKRMQENSGVKVARKAEGLSKPAARRRPASGPRRQAYDGGLAPRRGMRRPRSASGQVRAAMPLPCRFAEHRGMPEAGPLSEPGAAPLRSLKVNSFSQGCYLGVLGGMGPMAGAVALRLAALTPADVDQQHIPTLLRNDPRIPDRSSAYMAGGENPLPYMVEGVHFLERAGAQLIAIPCNTAHLWYDQITAATRLPVLHIIEAVIDDLRRLGLAQGPHRADGHRGHARWACTSAISRHRAMNAWCPTRTRSSAIAWARSAP